MKRYLIYFTALFLVATSCSTEEQPRTLYYYEDSEKILNETAEGIRTIFSLAGQSALATEIQYEIVVYRFYYTTTFRGEEITASGLLSIPVTSDPVPIVSFQRGTIVAHNEAPTVAWPDYLRLLYFSGAGYIMAIPDLIGFGASDQVLHPYYVSEAYADAILDMIQGAEEFVDLEGGNFNGDVFLTGYSEGGYATMAAHKAMEENPIEGFNLVASAPAAGGYDLKHFQEYFFGLETYDNPFFMAYVGASYYDNYFTTSDLSDYFQAPYASQIPDLVSGDYNGVYINASLTKTVADLLLPDLIENFETNPLYSDLKESLLENRLSEWKPQIPMYLYHGTADVTVPYENSVITYQKFIDAGASPDIIKMISIEGADHYTGATPYFLDVIQRFNSLK